MKAALAETCWQMLASQTPSEITMAALAQQCDVSETEAVLHAGDVTNLILYQLDSHDDEALQSSFSDFADDPDASVYEKLLEGLIMRFEVLAPSRAQLRNLHQEAIKNPLLAAHCLHQLSHTIGRLLYLAGDETTGLLKQLRVAGVVGVLMRVRSVWLDDDSADLGLTIKKLDDELKKACEWAVTLRVLRADEVTPDAKGSGVSGDE